VLFRNPNDAQYFKTLVETKDLQNMMFIGTRGTGKSSLSQALINDLGVSPDDVMTVNCSKDKIDAMRDRVSAFAYTMPVGDYKVIRLEEMDFLSHDAQALLRSLIEEVSSFCRFICTGNYKHRILPEVQDRFQIFEFNTPNLEDLGMLAADILMAEGVQFEIDDVLTIVQAGSPSVRKIIHLLQQGSQSGKLQILGESGVADWRVKFLEAIKTADFRVARSVVCQEAPKEELIDAYRFLFQNIDVFGKKADDALLVIARYQYQHSFVADPEIQLAAMFIELGAL
jgi:DNA polymerase III delta prime subunit